MMFQNKRNLNVLEVLHYDEGPCVFGFEQQDKFYLAYLKQTNQDDSSLWLICSLENHMKEEYDKLKENKILLADFMASKKCHEVLFDYDGSCLSEKAVLAKKKDIKNIVLSF